MSRIRDELEKVLEKGVTEIKPCVAVNDPVCGECELWKPPSYYTKNTEVDVFPQSLVGTCPYAGDIEAVEYGRLDPKNCKCYKQRLEALDLSSLRDSFYSGILDPDRPKKKWTLPAEEVVCGECINWDLYDYMPADPDVGLLAETLIGTCPHTKDRDVIGYGDTQPKTCLHFKNNPNPVDLDAIRENFWKSYNQHGKQEQTEEKNPISLTDECHAFERSLDELPKEGEIPMSYYFTKAYYLSKEAGTESLFLDKIWAKTKGDKSAAFVKLYNQGDSASLCDKCVSMDMKPDVKCADCEIHRFSLILCKNCRVKSLLTCKLCFHAR